MGFIFSSSMKKTLSRSVTRDNVIDFPIEFGIRKGFSLDKMVEKTVNAIIGIKNSIKNHVSWLANYESNLNETRNQAIKIVITQYIQQEKRVQEILIKKYPLLAEYENLEKKSTDMSGYFQKKMRKCMQDSKKIILKNSTLFKKFVYLFPEKTRSLNISRGKASEHNHER